MILLRGRIDLSPSLLEYRFKNKLLQSLFGGLLFYYVRYLLYVRTPFRSLLTRRTVMNERIAEYPYIVAQLARYPQVSTVLDIGGAFSLLPTQLATSGFKVTSLDLNECSDVYHPDLAGVVSDLFEHKLPEGSFDAVVSVSTIEHMGFGEFGDKVLPDADLRAFEIIHKLLKPGGIAVLTLPVVEPTSYWRDKITYFSKERVATVTKGFEILDQRLLNRQSRQVKDAEIDYFTPANEIGGTFSIHLLTLRKPVSATTR